MTAALVGVARVLPLVLLAPPLGGRSWLQRALVAALLVGVAWPALGHPPPPGALAPTLAREVAVGLLLGLLVAVPFRAAEAAGALVDDAVALAVPGAPRDRRRVFGEGYGLFALALFATLDGPRLAAAGVLESYRAFPVGSVPSATAGARLTVGAGAQLVASAAAIAAPALTALLLTDLFSGLIVRAQPAATQLIGAPALRLIAVVLVLAIGAAAATSAITGGGLLERVLDGARSLR
jgi:flagellar biosynthesis protein FliR